MIDVAAPIEDNLGDSLGLGALGNGFAHGLGCGNIQGAQFFAVAGAVYEAARAGSIGRVLPTEWFLQDIRD